MAKKATLWYTLGEAEKATGIPRTRLDHACRVKRLSYRRSETGARLLSQDTVEKLRKDGLKAFPRPYDPASAPPESEQPSASNNPHQSRRQHVDDLKLQAEELLAERELDRLRSQDDQTIKHKEISAHASVMAEKRELEQIRLEAAQIADTRREKEREAKAERRRRQWETTWTEYALNLVPQDAPRGLALEVREAALDLLRPLEPDQPRELTQRLVQAAVEKTLQPWLRTKEIEKAISEARNQLPFFAKGAFKPTEWEARATHAASEAIAKLECNAPLARIRATAIEAGNRVRAEYEAWRTAEDHQDFCQQLVDSVFLVGGTPEQERHAVQAVKEAVVKFPVGTSHTELMRCKDATLAPFRTAARAARDADQYLAHVGNYIERLDTLENGPGHFEGYSERGRLAQQIAKKIRPFLIEKLRQESLERDDALHFIEELVDTKLDAPG
jgi:hypothetical protein